MQGCRDCPRQDVEVKRAMDGLERVPAALHRSPPTPERSDTRTELQPNGVVAKRSGNQNEEPTRARQGTEPNPDSC